MPEFCIFIAWQVEMFLDHFCTSGIFVTPRTRRDTALPMQAVCRPHHCILMYTAKRDVDKASPTKGRGRNKPSSSFLYMRYPVMGQCNNNCRYTTPPCKIQREQSDCSHDVRTKTHRTEPSDQQPQPQYTFVPKSHIMRIRAVHQSIFDAPVGRALNELYETLIHKTVDDQLQLIVNIHTTPGSSLCIPRT